MISNTKLCALVVLLCVITPISVGFAWPSLETSDTIHEIGPSVSITDDLNNGSTLLYNDFGNYYRNNMFIYSNTVDHPISSDVAAVSVSSVPSSIPNTYGNVSALTTTEYFADQYLDIPDFIAWCEEIASDNGITGDYIMTFTYLGSNASVLEQWCPVTPSDGTQGGQAILVQYNKTSGQVTWYDIADHPHNISNCGMQIEALFSFSGFVPGDRTITVNVSIATGYVDITQGLAINTAGGPGSYWTNGYDNIGIDVMIKTENNASLTLQPYKISQSSTVTVSVVNGEISLEATGADSVVLGSSASYPFVVLSLDTSTGTCTLYGLAGVIEFGAWRFNVVSSVSIDGINFEDSLINTLAFDKVLLTTGAQAVNFLVVNSVAGLITIPASSDSIVDLKGYYPGDSQLQISSIQQYPIGECIYLDVNGSRIATGTSDVSKDLTILGKTFDLNGIVFTVIGKDVYINGEVVYSSITEIRQLEITLKGTWLANIQYAKITDKEIPSYGWSWINFGLDQSGFCMCGLLTAAGSGIAAMLAGRRSGSKMALVSLTAICCAAVYLTLLMTA